MAELARVRTSFVEKVSKDMIKQLLDDLLEDGVLNEGEKDSIIEENMTTKDKARALIDSVKKKGNVASRKMIAHLQTRDPTLYATLDSIQVFQRSGALHTQTVPSISTPVPGSLRTWSDSTHLLMGISLFHQPHTR